MMLCLDNVCVVFLLIAKICKFLLDYHVYMYRMLIVHIHVVSCYTVKLREKTILATTLRDA